MPAKIVSALNGVPSMNQREIENFRSDPRFQARELKSVFQKLIRNKAVINSK